MAPVGQQVLREAQLREVDRWARLGVAVVPGIFGRKGPWPDDWPRLSHEDTWRLARSAIQRGPVNLAVRLGETGDGHYLGHLDLDGKCPCGSDLADHESGGRCLSDKCRSKNACACSEYHGVAPDLARARLLSRLPAGVVDVKTGRGYRLLFLVPAPLIESVLPEFGAEVSANSGRLSIVPPSRHPSGDDYVYLTPPGASLPVVDLGKLGLFPQPKGGCLRQVRDRTSESRGNLPPAAPPTVVAEFAVDMARRGIYEGGGNRRDSRGEFFPCPWHHDTEASLHVLWQAAVFCCFGCDLSGGVRELRAVTDGSALSPRKLPNGCSSLSNRGTNGGVDLLVEKIAALADELPAGTLNVEGRELRACRQYVVTYRCSEGHEFAPRNEHGNPTPLSCDASAGICARCGPTRFLRDARACDVGLPERVNVYRLIARAAGLDISDVKLSRRLTARLKVYRESHGLTAGSAARSLHLEPNGEAFRGHFIVAVPTDAAARVTSDGAFAVEDLGEKSLEEWHWLQVAEQRRALERLETAAQLEAFYLAMRGQQQFRHCGEWYGKRVDAATGEERIAKSAGGSGSGPRNDAAERVFCPLHPRAAVRRTLPVLRSLLVCGDGGVLIPTAGGPKPGADAVRQQPVGQGAVWSSSGAGQ
jgi:Bifunctional DNA primase/polymerase, N-terminal